MSRYPPRDQWANAGQSARRWCRRVDGSTVGVVALLADAGRHATLERIADLLES
jgi:hypothetical protein